MKQNMSKKYSLILIIFLVIVTIGLTYSFFANQGNILFNNDVSVTSNTTDLLTFQIDNDIDFEVSQQDFVSGGNNKSGYTNARAILVPNNKTGNATMNYYMYLNIEDNPIDYSSTNTNDLPELMLQLYDGNNELVTINYLDEMVTVKGVTGYDITGFEGLIPLLDNQEIVASNNTQTTQEWKVVVTFINLDINQNDNTGKELIAEVIMQKDEYTHGEYISGNLAVSLKKSLIHNNLLKEYRGEGYYHDENDKDNINPFFTKPIFYWQTNDDNTTEVVKEKWNVVFADICWQAYRTTENGGVKLVYNGEPIVKLNNTTGKNSYDCSSNRPNHVAFGEKTTLTGLSDSVAVYYGTGYVFDENNNTFKLTGDIISKVWNTTTAGELESMYTCKSTNQNASCGTIYLVESYNNATTANVYPMSFSTTTYFEYVSNDINFGNKLSSLSSVGYMYNEEYNVSSKSMDNTTETLLNSTSQLFVNTSNVNNNYYFSDNYTYNGTNYILSNAETAQTIISSNNLGNTNLLGMYTCLSTATSCATIYQIIEVNGNNLGYISATSGLTPFTTEIYSIYYSGDQILVQNKSSAGSQVRLISNVSGYNISSFMVNGTLIDGDTFIMPSEDVTITDIKFIVSIVVESAHNPYPNSINYVTDYENTFTGATSISVDLKYQTEACCDLVAIYDNNGGVEYKNATLQTQRIILNGNYIKIVFKTDGSVNNFYGYKAIITPIGSAYEGNTINNSGDGSGSLSNYKQLLYYYPKIGSSITDNNDGTYSLNNPVTVNWYNDYNSYNNYYICKDGISTTCSYNEMRRIINGTNNSYNHYFSSNMPIKIASSVTKDGDNYILNNPMEIDSVRWLNNYTNYSNSYICSTGSGTICPNSNLRFITSTTSTGYTHFPIYIYSNKFTYNNGTYTLDMSDSNAINVPGQGNNYDRIGKAHYTCFNSSGVCSTINYVYRVDNNVAYYLTLTSGKYFSTDESNTNVFKNNNNVLYTMLYSDNVNSKNSPIKTIIEGWYAANLIKYDSYIDKEEIYCNDRRTGNNYGSWNNNANNITTDFNFVNNTSNGNINCRVKNDSFSATETNFGNGNLTYPVGLVSAPETNLMNYLARLPNRSKSVGIYDISHDYDYWLMSPSYFGINENHGSVNGVYSYFPRVVQSGAYGEWIWAQYYHNHLRPAISLLPDALEYSQGDGSTTNPFLINVGNSIILNDINYRATKSKAVEGENIIITNEKYIVGTFKLNGETVVGNSFVMPDRDAEITDLRVYKIKTVDSNPIIKMPNSAIPGTTVEISFNVNQGYSVTSFKLNGTTILDSSFVMPYDNVVISDIVYNDNLSSLRNNPNYRILEYIESSGTQYINTGYYQNINTKLEFETMVTDTRTEDIWTQITGSKNSYHASSAIQAAYNPYSRWVALDYGTNSADGMIINKNTKFKVIIANNEHYINGTRRNQNGTFSGTTSYPLYIFDTNSSGARERAFIGRIYYYKIYNGTELDRWFIPSIRVSDNEIGLYDVINDVFYPNNGTGKFIKSELTYNISNSNNSVIIPKTAEANSTITIKPITEGNTVTSFRLNGELITGNSFIMPYSNVIITDIVNVDALTALKNNSNYEIVDYIESSGSQYINTNYYATINTKVELEAMATSTSNSSSWTQITGARVNYHSPASIQVAFNTSSNDLAIEYGYSNADGMRLYKNGRFTVIVANNNHSINGISRNQNGEFVGKSNYPLWIFDDNSAGNSENRFTGRIYSYKIYENDSIERNFIPVKRLSDNTYGLYDIANSVFYGNLGSGNFTGGKALTEEEATIALNNFNYNHSYQIKEYIESNGGQLLKTNIYADINTKLEFETMITDTRTSDIWPQLTGARETLHSPASIQVAFNPSSNYLAIEYGNNGVNGMSISRNEKFKVKIGNNAHYINNNIRTQLGTFTGVSNYPLWIFDDNSANSREQGYIGRMYYYKAYYNDKIILYLIPCIRKSDNVAGMYDVVNDIFYTNQGSGTFTVPN